MHQSITQLLGAYLKMAEEAQYRPAAPSDGFGNITVPLEELDLDAEARKYAARWWAEEDEMTFWLGCCDYKSRPATVYAVEAARCMNGGDQTTAKRLLQLAVDSLP
jgi:hypothetical protein